MRLADFILANVEPILVEWEAFARRIWPSALVDAANDPATLRDHAEEILRGSARDMVSAQSDLQQSAKSMGEKGGGATSARINKASERHGIGRVTSGFEMWGLVAEFRALRATVLRLWRDSRPVPDLRDLDDITRFNECIDQSLTESVRSYTQQVARDRETLLADERASRSEAEAANRAKDMFLATLSHEMRTPLNAIVGWMAILRSKGYQDEDLTEALNVIERNTKAQAQLIEDVLDVSRIISGKLRLETVDADLRDAITAGIEVVAPAAAARDIRLDVQLPADTCHAIYDPTRLQQVVWNLVSNAVKFTQRGGAVRIALERDGSSWAITVSDNGPGIPPDVLPFIFDRFRQADSSSRRKFGGLGLGLSIVKQLVAAHGGSVAATSDGEDHGSTFTVRLPIRALIAPTPADPSTGQEAVPPPPPARAAVRLDGLHLLVVDDEADARHMLEIALRGLGATVAVAASAAEALMLLFAQQPNRPHVFISDLGMPEQDGYDLIRELRQRGKTPEELPAIALSGFARKDDSRRALQAGFQVHLPKPVNLVDLTITIATLTGRPA